MHLSQYLFYFIYYNTKLNIMTDIQSKDNNTPHDFEHSKNSFYSIEVPDV